MEFHCKEFSLNHTKSSMKIGTDSILLSSLTPQQNSKKILDIGTGCGIIALCMAQKYPNSQITAIDIDKNSIEEASDNFKKSKYNARLLAQEIDLKTFTRIREERFDLIVTNPPYFISSLESPYNNRNKARHTISLNFQDLIQSAERLLSKCGILSLILPTIESQIFEAIAIEKGIQTIYKANIYSKPGKECERIVLHLQKKQESTNNTNIKEEIIILRNPDNTPSQIYKNLIKDYLL